MSAETLLVLGATGDLAGRWLLPGLGALLTRGGANGLDLIGCATEQWSDARWRQQVSGAFAAVPASGVQVDAVLRETRYIGADVMAESGMRRVLDACSGRRIIYFALPPHVTMKVCQVLQRMGVPAGTRLVMEKPFGTDAVTAETLNALLAQTVPENDIYRVDHYLAMAGVLNIAGLRFASRVLEPLLDRDNVQSVDIVSEEDFGLAGRVGYYDSSGALVDVIQSHLLQVLALIAMDRPDSFGVGDLREAKARVLRATHVWNDDPVASSRRARYTAGEVAGRQLQSYTDLPGVDPVRSTETFAEVTLAVDTARWSGVRFRLRTGKALGVPNKAGVVTFRQAPWMPLGFAGRQPPNRLVIGFDPRRLNLMLNINGPGEPRVIDPVTLDATFGPGDLPPYGILLSAILAGSQLLSVRADTAVQCWRIVQPVLDAWRNGDVPLETYAAGSSGPSRPHDV
jgi:glucose-6-phosphate 1-dehydrogenase